MCIDTEYKENEVLDINDVNIDSLEGFYFSKKVVNYLKSCSIYTLKDLICVFDNPELCVLYLAKKGFYSEIASNLRIIRCKYFNEDPLININDDTANLIYLFEQLGIMYRSCGSSDDLLKSVSVKEAFEFVRNNPDKLFAILMKLRNIGAKKAEFIMNKIKIVVNYYEKNVNNKPVEEEYEDVLAEFKRLKKERQELDEKIALVLEKINNKLDNGKFKKA